jgi:hypothetical protein
MVRELYTRSPDDPNYQYGIYDHNDPIEAIISKIKMIFGTSQGQVLGDLNFGVGLEELVFQTRINKTELEERIKRQITQYISEASKYRIKPSVSFGRTDSYDYCVIDIFINEENVIGILVK